MTWGPNGKQETTQLKAMCSTTANASGHQFDAQLFDDSELKECIGDNTIHFPDSDTLPNDDRDTHYYIMGDDAIPVRTFFMKSYGRRGLNNSMLVASYRSSRDRCVVVNGFGILANRWRCFLGTLV